MTDRREAGSEAMSVLAEVNNMVVICMMDNVIHHGIRALISVHVIYLDIFLSTWS